MIEKVLGEGGFGITYKVWHENLQAYVVIKTLNDELRHDPDYQKFEEKFKQEARILQRLSQQKNNHIVRVTDLFEENNIWYLVMDFVEGESLENLVQHRILSETEAVNYIRQIAEALIVVHCVGLVHRDAHPGNIMIQNDGTAILIDFGIAGEIIPSSRYKSSKQFAHQVFAPYEQLFGVREPTLDVYTLAGSLYYAVTGKLPVSGAERYTQLILQRQSDPLIPPEKHNPHISNDVKLAIEKGMKLEPQYRSQSMSKWLELLPDNNVQSNYQQNINNSTPQTVKPGIKSYPISPTPPVPKRYVPIQNQPDIARILTDILAVVGHGLKVTLLFTIDILKSIVNIIGDVLVGVFNVLGDIVAAVSYLPWLSLGYITFYYSILGFLSGSSAFAIASASGIAFGFAIRIAFSRAFVFAVAFGFAITRASAITIAIAIAIAIAFAFAFGVASASSSTIAIVIPSAISIGITFDTISDFHVYTFLGSYLLIMIALGLIYGWYGVAGGIILWVLLSLLLAAYGNAYDKLEQRSLSEWKRFFIIAGTSLLGLFLGWLTYQFFPIFTNT